MLEASDKNVEEGVRGAGNHGAVNANRKLLGGGGRKHWGGGGIFEQVTDVTRMPSTAPTPHPQLQGHFTPLLPLLILSAYVKIKHVAKLQRALGFHIMYLNTLLKYC
jgi:hypothetical protein